jgi:hypothetical protein
MNPTGQPFQPPFSQEPPPSDARNDLNVPSILILVMAGLGVLYSLYGLVSSSAASSEQLNTMMNDPNFPPAARDVIGALTGGLAKGLNAFGMLLDGLIIYGAVQMRNLKMFPMALTSAILVMLPCVGCCCLFGLPIGIWTLTILLRPEVRAQFT